MLCSFELYFFLFRGKCPQLSGLLLSLSHLSLLPKSHSQEVSGLTTKIDPSDKGSLPGYSYRLFFPDAEKRGLAWPVGEGTRFFPNFDPRSHAVVVRRKEEWSGFTDEAFYMGNDHMEERRGEGGGCWFSLLVTFVTSTL